jgi:molybdopterin converting factor small subunit
MIINITLYGILREKQAKETRGKISLQMPEGSRISDVLQILNIDSHIYCVYNGNHRRDYQTILQDQDEISFIPPVGGGAQEEKQWP